MLASLLSVQRGQSLHYLLIRCQKMPSSFTFIITNVVNQSKAETKQPVLKFDAYTDDERLCIVTLLREHIHRTTTIRGQNSQLYPATLLFARLKQKWKKLELTLKFKRPHGTRAASTSAANQKFSSPGEYIRGSRLEK